MEKSILKIIGNNIRQRRKLRGLTQEQLAELVGTNFSYIGKMERGEHNVKIETLQKVANALDVSLPSLLSNGIFNDIEVSETVLEAATLLLNKDESDQHKAVEMLKLMFRPKN